MDAFEVLEWMVENKICLCGGALEEVSETELRCQKCGLTIRIVEMQNRKNSFKNG